MYRGYYTAVRSLVKYCFYNEKIKLKSLGFTSLLYSVKKPFLPNELPFIRNDKISGINSFNLVWQYKCMSANTKLPTKPKSFIQMDKIIENQVTA